ncbi:hypothetical protein HOLleu_02511 [Holothuria leucospilota]|uniref:Uncharacterized protein n=1 Tax=Holothuria leucospilota TaxID=206669 RepID=A0A9Q1CPQ3_HOLLE|nr:hypothetical protein HOLleu_02511 [Holothuria leucospilota]
MGNSQRIFAITVPNPTSDNQDPNAPPSYLILSARRVKSILTRGERYRDVFEMVDVRSRQVAGYFEKRNSNGTKGWFGKNLDLGLKVGILSAAVTICREKHDRSGD